MEESLARANLFAYSLCLGVATALELLGLVCFCIALSTGQLPLQTVCPVRIATFFATEVAPFRGKVRFANVLRACWANCTVPVTLELFNN